MTKQDIKQMHQHQLETKLNQFFDECSASDYIAAINTFVLQRVESAKKHEKSDLFQILRIMELLPFLSEKINAIKKIE